MLNLQSSLSDFITKIMAKCPFHLERIYSIVAGSPGIPGFSVCHIVQNFCKDETEFPNIQMPFGVHTVSDREL